MDKDIEEIVLTEKERKHALAMKEEFEDYEKIQELANRKNIKIDFCIQKPQFLKKRIINV